MDGIFSEKQMRLLTQPLYTSWRPAFPFVAMANVGLFYSIHKPAIVPDVLLSTDVELPTDLFPKEHRSYFVWEYGKPPEAAIEIVSNLEGGELDRKPPIYAMIGVLYYVVWDPAKLLSEEPLQCFVVRERKYVRHGAWLDALGIGLTEWTGRFENLHATWLRWCDARGGLLLTGDERAARLVEQLRSLGIEPQA